jgi:ribonuclease Z
MLGTGNPAPNPERFGPATVILVDKTPYLVDFGVGVVRRWAAALKEKSLPLSPVELKIAFLTHLHSDHTLGYAELIFTPWTVESNTAGVLRGPKAGPKKPLEVFGPEGIAAMTHNIVEAYREDIRIRTGPGGEAVGNLGPAVSVHEIKQGVIFRDERVTVTAFDVHHGTWSRAFGFRFQTQDKNIVLSGDAGPPSSIPDYCDRWDIVVHEGGVANDDSEYFRDFIRRLRNSQRSLTKRGRNC